MPDASLPEDVARRIAADFSAESSAAIAALLAEYGGPERARVARCILHLAHGSAAKLLELVGTANTDYRDVIYCAECDRDGRRVRDLGQPFGLTPTGFDDVASSFIGGRPFLPAGADIPPLFLTRYQTNFRIVVSDVAAARLCTDDVPLIEQSAIDLKAWRVGAEPQWLLDDETPASYGSLDAPVFLFQVPLGMTFPTCPGAPLQKTLDLEGEAVDADRAYHELFLGNASYFFGFGAPAGERTYVVTQVE